MKPIHDLIQKLNNSSQKILDEINSEEPSIEYIKDELNSRESLVKKLNSISEIHPYNSFSISERASLKTKFDTFIELNNSIHSNLKTMLSRQREKIVTAVKQRKVEKQYTVSNKPDISYF